MRFLPTRKEQGWLIDAIGDLVRAGGYEPFVLAPIVEPTRQFLPESWRFNRHGLDRLTRRLMQYAGLTDLNASVEVVPQADLPPLDDHGCRNIAAQFLGIEDGVCRFVVSDQTGPDEAVVAGVMAHEVAHAFRARHNLVVDGPDEELLTDVTAVYLGFGVLVANNSYRFRTSGELRGNSVTHSVSSQQFGYLPPQAFSYLFGLQIWARQSDGRDEHEVIRYLEANQAAFTREAIRAAGVRGESLFERLGFPEEWGEPHSVENVLQPLPESPYDPSERGFDRVVPTVSNAGRPVFRVRRTRAPAWSLAFSLLATVAGSAIGILWPGYPGFIFIGLFAGVIGGVVGGLRGKRIQYHVCSEPQCEVRLPLEARTCPNCGGTISGIIEHELDRLKAEDELLGDEDPVEEMGAELDPSRRTE